MENSNTYASPIGINVPVDVASLGSFELTGVYELTIPTWYRKADFHISVESSGPVHNVQLFLGQSEMFFQEEQA